MRELGTIRALGTTQGEVFSLLVGEGLWLGVLGGGVGVLGGIALAALFNAAGIPWQPPGTVEAVALGVDLTPRVVGIPWGVSVLSTALSAVLPAYQATRVPPAEALRAV
ncbi:MAG: FtsX-like permease family protein [Candidatus Bipolaricaulota bacterium]|nr:FtsX-like permease family protein [Candidatus Bipolaricaulota bacterium]